MSLLAPTSSPAPAGPLGRASGPRGPAPRLQVVAAPSSTRRRLPFAATCTGVLVLALLSLLMLNISLTRGAYDVQALQREATLLGEREQALTEQLATEASPAQVSARATGLGMVPSTNPAFIRLSDGAVLGVPQPAQPPVAPTVEPAPAAPAVPGETPVAADTSAPADTLVAADAPDTAVDD